MNFDGVIVVDVIDCSECEISAPSGCNYNGNYRILECVVVVQ